ncbi:MAG TPA: aminoglycoside phosphotransferase [Frankiaceae bacterium]|nr:aminoglycoside phosphotransferase [Frankiaceae bacterium]
MSIEAALADWLPRQRWYADKGRALPSVKAELVATLQPGSPRLDLYVVHAHDDRYQVPLSFRAEADEQLAHAMVGEADGEFVYDAPQDPAVNGAWLRLMAAGESVAGVVFTGPDVVPDLPARPLSAEQSNTSLIYGDTYFLKLYRRLTDSPNPDLEVARALGEIGSAATVPALGWAEGAGSTLALMQPFVRNATDGWALALTSVRDLYAERDLHADEVGGDFAPESHRLGHLTATLHADLARALPARLSTAEESVGTAQMLRDRLAAGVAAVPELAPYAAAVEAAYTDVADCGEVPIQRIHGDFHLGQCMRTGEGWVVLDFEGEPARPLPERTALMSPLRDVAGMLRSFDYAARHLLADHPGRDQLIYRAVEWADRNRDAFCDGYASFAGVDPRESATLLRAFELDKAVYEVRYEASHRPTWLSIPLSGIERLVS